MTRCVTADSVSRYRAPEGREGDRVSCKVTDSIGKQEEEEKIGTQQLAIVVQHQQQQQPVRNVLGTVHNV